MPSAIEAPYRLLVLNIEALQHLSPFPSFRSIRNCRVEYPFKPPYFNFATRIWHPNIYNNGKVSLDVLVLHWTPTPTIKQALLNISFFLEIPKLESLSS